MYDQCNASAHLAQVLFLPVHTPIFKDGKLTGCSCGFSDCLQRNWGKHPRVAEWQRKASNKPNQIRAWRHMWPDCNFGIKPDGFHVLDEDIPGALAAFVPPATFTVATSRGRHLYYAIPPDLILGSPALTEGVDTRGNNGYVLAPGSLHQSGVRYRVIDDRPMAPMPAQILEALMRRSNTDHAREESKAEKSSLRSQEPLPAAVDDLKLRCQTKRYIREGAPEGEQRHPILASVIKSMQLADYDEEQTFAICFNPAHGISSKPLEMRDGGRWLRGQIRKVRSWGNSGGILSTMTFEEVMNFDFSTI